MVGNAFHTGFTTTFNPNQSKIDFQSVGENGDPVAGGVAGYPTFASMNSRSTHVGCVNILFLDGSARTISENIYPLTWQALGSRSGAEVLGEY